MDTRDTSADGANELAQPATHTSTHLLFEGVSKSFGARRVLTDISFAVAAGSRIGLIGENGTGKSTLLRIAADLECADAGSVSVVAPTGITPRIGILHQEPPFAPTDTILTAIHSATAPVRAALAELDRAGAALAEPAGEALGTEPHADASAQDSAAAADAAAAYSRAIDDVERLNGWELDSRVDQVIAGLGLSDIPRSRESRAMSGGQRARLSLAWLLLNAPDVLLLDEPTNHLDDDASDYLAHMLTAWRGPVLFASHDRAFLDGTTTALIDLDPSEVPESVAERLVADGTGSAIGVTRFTGSYSDYLKIRRAERKRWEHKYAEEQSEIRRLTAAVGDSQTVGHSDWKPRTETRMAQKFYADRNAKVVARRVNDARSRLAALTARQIAAPPAQLSFAGIAAPASLRPATREQPGAATEQAAQPAKLALLADSAEVAGRLAPTTLRVRAGDKLLITGPNGAGKSTLLRALAGLQPLSGGIVRVAASSEIGLLDQEISFADPRERGSNRTAAETYVDGVGAARAAAVPLQRFGLLAVRDEEQQLDALSVGQQRRLALAILIADPPEILLLDEPTNHLSLALVEAVELAIQSFPGTVLVASHDRWLRSRWQGGRYALATAAPTTATPTAPSTDTAQ
ncbi:ABC-F family ATP-binding cassette domain-containing protein [Leucobacter komagatae]|uniref:ABC-F family ATP-binding cassette domain-containing protein n=1 Tax=Leucobacter komagatae TaxID=55969 RepID=UPI0005ABDD48|nr:ABC-F family ATP-binding cassette domain-containing protein [Leucobacter komagatae]